VPQCPIFFILYYRYSEPDAEAHPVYDKYTTAHDALIAARAQARLRQFNARTLNQRRPTMTQHEHSAVPRNIMVPNGAPAAQIALDDADDSDPIQWHEGFNEKRQSLIEHFNIAWNNNKVAWLPFPGTGRK
jgi:hypothetical protein